MIESRSERGVVGCQLHGLATTLNPSVFALDLARNASLACTVLRQRQQLFDCRDLTPDLRDIALHQNREIVSSVLLSARLWDSAASPQWWLRECEELIGNPLLHLDLLECQVRTAHRQRLLLWTLGLAVQAVKQGDVQTAISLCRELAQ